LYSKQAATTANPYVLRAVNQSLSFSKMTGGHAPVAKPLQAEADRGAQLGGMLALPPRPPPVAAPSSEGRRRSDSPPRAAFKLVSAAPVAMQPPPGLALSLTSLSSNRAFQAGKK
jgi:hypothetical protein